jgi:hypothetical protein
MDKCRVTPPLFRLAEHHAASCYLMEEHPTIESARLSDLLPT